MRTVLLTGASGFIGHALARAFKARAWRVMSAGRRPPTQGFDNHHDWRLGEALPFELQDVDLVLHLACAALGSGEAAQLGGELDLKGTELILDQLRALPPQLRPCFIFLSSQSAVATARTAYGRSKFAIEGLLAGPDEIAVRPGLVYGPGAASVFSTLSRLGRAPLLPVPRDRAAIQLIHVDDLAEALLRIGEGAGDQALWRLGAPVPLSLRAVVEVLAHGQGRNAPVFIEVPEGLLMFCARLIDGVLKPNSRLTERVVGLLNLQPMHTRADLALLRLDLRPLKSRAITARVREARALMLAVGGKSCLFALRPLVRWLQAKGHPDLSNPLTRLMPSLLRATEPFGDEDHRGATMLRALALRETHEAHLRWNAGPRHRKPLSAALRLAALLCLEACMVPLRLQSPSSKRRSALDLRRKPTPATRG